MSAAAVVTAAVATYHSQSIAAPILCEQLARLTRPGLIVTAMFGQAGFDDPPGASSSIASLATRPFCRVRATLEPRAGSSINIEVWMPSFGWNGRLQGVGNGGWSGAIAYPDLAMAVNRGYAVAATDTGHSGASGSFALDHPEQLVDFAYRAVHEMTVEAKAIVNAFYGSRPRRSVWTGCSSGGREGLVEAQRFPDDYDGIIAGAPANAWTHLAASTVWIAQATLMEQASYLSRAQYKLLHDAALDACDGTDGVRDGVIGDPTRCRFDPQILQCRNENDSPGCLTPPQVNAARKIYGGPKNPRTGQAIFPGLEPGSELGWGELAGGPKLGSSADDHFKYVVFRNPRWDFRTFDFDRDVALADQIDGGMINAVDPKITAFAAHGGRLLLYHGWSDPLIAPRSTVDYYTDVVAALGGSSKAAESVRLFMAPGMDHCGGGAGASGFDMLAALERWLESGKPPESVIASHSREGVVDRTRPLCPYPLVAQYKGVGGADDAVNFACKSP